MRPFLTWTIALLFDMMTNIERGTDGIKLYGNYTVGGTNYLYDNVFRSDTHDMIYNDPNDPNDGFIEFIDQYLTGPSTANKKYKMILTYTIVSTGVTFSKEFYIDRGNNGEEVEGGEVYSPAHVWGSGTIAESVFHFNNAQEFTAKMKVGTIYGLDGISESILIQVASGETVTFNLQFGELTDPAII